MQFALQARRDLAVPLSLERLEICARYADHLTRYSSEGRYLQAVAATRRSFLDRVQKHELIAVLGGIQMNVHTAFGAAGERGQFEIVGREQGVCPDFGRDVSCRSPRQ